MHFVGLEPWTQTWGEVTCITPGGVVDLHNNAHVREIVLRMSEEALYILFEYAADWRNLDTADSHILVLAFGNVRDLTLSQSESFDSRSALDFDGYGYQLVKNVSRITLQLADTTVQFAASQVVLENFDNTETAHFALTNLLNR